MKKMLLLCGLFATGILSPRAAHAESGTATRTILISTLTCQGGVSISTGLITGSSANTSVLTSTVPIYTFINVLNEDTAANLFCNEFPNVATSGARKGRKIVPGASVLFYIPQGENWYCISDGAAATAAGLCKGR